MKFIQLKNLRASKVFNIIAILLIIIMLLIFVKFTHTKEKITNIYMEANLAYVEDFTNNIKQKIEDEVDIEHYRYEFLNKHPKIKEGLEKDIGLFITQRYKYIYVLDKKDEKSKEYRFLLDGTKEFEDKSDLGESYTPLEITKFQELQKKKKPLYFTHSNIESLWITYLNPIVKNNKVVAVIVVDFSMKDYNIIEQILKNFTGIFRYMLIFVIFISILIVWFSRVDSKREKEKSKIYSKLKAKTKELEEESFKVHQLNLTLEERVAKELEKNRQKDQQMIEQSRLAQMGEMISMIAHQWRQPLTAISSTSGALELKATLGSIDNETVIDLSKKISGYAQHLSSTIDDFRSFFKSSKEKIAINYNDIVKDVFNIIKSSIENKNIKLTYEDSAKKDFYTYPNEVKQVILNLIKNAEDILIEKNIEDAYIKLRSYVEGDYIVLEVCDNGGGVPEEIITKVFDPYFSTKHEKDGTGLGLYMSKTIVIDHCAGEITVSNNKDGAVFKIALKSM